MRLIFANSVKEEKPSTLGLGSAIAERFRKTGLDEPLPELPGQGISSMDLQTIILDTNVLSKVFIV